jgi:hypothetical protein
MKNRGDVQHANVRQPSVLQQNFASVFSSETQFCRAADVPL